MEQPDVLRQEQEIARLNRVITLLLQQIELLKKENALMWQQLRQNSAVYSPYSQQDVSNNAVYSRKEEEMGVNSIVDTHVFQQMGTNSSNHSNLLQQEGINSPVYSNVEQSMAMNSSVHSNLSQQLPSNKNIASPTAQSTVSFTLPDNIAANDTLLYKIAELLRLSGMTRVKVDTRKTAARLLIHFHNGEPAGYAALTKLTRYSQGGIAKLLISMRKQNLISRVAFQKFGLTAKSNEILVKALS